MCNKVGHEDDQAGCLTGKNEGIFNQTSLFLLQI